MPLKLTDLPDQVLVSILIEVYKMSWVRYSFASVCKAFRDLYRSRDASPLHETLWLDFEDEVAMAKRMSSRRPPRREPVVRASRVISWARTHAESVRKLYLALGNGAPLGDFKATNFAQLVSTVGPRLTEIGIDTGCEKLLGPPFWTALRARVVPARKLSLLRVTSIPKGVSMSDVEPLGQLRVSLEELILWRSDLVNNEPLQIDAPLDYLIKCCPRLRFVKMKKGPRGAWTRQSLAHLWAFKLKLLEKNPSAEVEFR